MDGTPRFSWTPSRLGRTIALSVLVGILAGAAARAMEGSLQLLFPRLIGSVVRPGEAFHFDPSLDWRLILFPALGGTLSGLVAGLLCRPAPPGVHGNGILIDAFHNRKGRLHLRDAALKAAAALAVIVMGGSVGKEAPVAVLSAAIGSALAVALRMTPRETRIFLVAGCAAGVGAIFQCPLGGALFATTVLYREPDVEADGLMPSIISSVIGYSTFMSFGGFGERLLRGTHGLSFRRPVELGAYLFLGVLCAAAGILLYYSLKFSTRAAERYRLPRWAGPAAAGLLVGLIACLFPQVMDAQYQFVQNSLDRRFLAPEENPWMKWVLFFSLVVVAKCVATGLMVGANTPGGLFGPVVFIGGATGAACGACLEAFLPGTFPESLREALIPVGMGGVLAASLRVPLAAVVMVMEMTGSYGLIVPLMLTSVVAYILGRRWGLYGEQVAGVEQSPAHAGESIISLLESWKVSDLMERSWPYVAAPAATLPQLVAALPPGSRPCYAVVDGGRLAGVISIADFARLAQSYPTQHLIAHDLMTTQPKTVSPEDDLYGVLGLFREESVDAVPVVSPEDGAFLGMLTRGGIYQALRDRVSRVRSEMLQEHAEVAAFAQDGHIEALVSGLAVHRTATLQQIPVPPEVVGKSLREADFRRRFGEVIAIRTSEGEVLAPPDPNRPLKAEDALVLLPRSEE